MKKEESKSKKSYTFLEKLRHFSYVASVYIQYFITFTIIVAIGITFLSLPYQWSTLTDLSSNSLINFLKYIINIIIAVELIRVLCHQTLDTIVEILMIAITRELIIEHMATWEILLGVLAVGLLFLIRKYLFISQLDRENRLELHPEEDIDYKEVDIKHKSDSEHEEHEEHEKQEFTDKPDSWMN